VRRGGLWAKQMGLKRGAIGNTLGKPIWELEGNMLGTKEKINKSLSPPLVSTNVYAY
jgi:hypothetical protein